MSLIAPTLQSFFTDRLANQRHASPRTIASYRDSLRMLVVFVQERTGRPASALDWQDRADVLNTTRQILLAAVGGLAVITGLAFTARTYYLTRRGQLTDRYTRAITQLASDKLAERLGGIYALEHLMVESQRDHDTVIEVLAAFIRENTATAHPAGVKEPLPSSEFTPPRPATDVQAAFTVLCRRPERPERLDINLRRVDLRGVEASGARLAGVDFSGAALQRAVLTRANLFGCGSFGVMGDHAARVNSSR
jgi:hypothetical protein